MPRRCPDFLIVGAPKAGTTSLHRYLAQHPDIFFPPGKKEPLFFCGYAPEFAGPGADSLNRSMVSDPAAYEALYESAAASMITGEASTDYLACSAAAERIKNWNPDARIIIMLRDPVQRAYSEHMHLVRDHLEKGSFLEALNLEEQRKQEGYIPLFWHRERGLYSAAVERYFRLFGRERVKVIVYEDFAKAPQDIVGEVFEFIGVEPIVVDVSSRFNVSGVPRWPLLQSLYVRFRRSDDQGWAKKLARAAMSGPVRRSIRALYLRRGLRASEGATLEERRLLREYFKDDVMRLGELLGRDLSDWLSVSEQV